MECRCVVDTAAAPRFGEREAPPRREVTAIDGGDTFAVAIDGAGRVLGWGRAFYGELGDEGDDGDGDAVVRELAVSVDCASVACGRNHVLALSREGASVFAWGWNRWGQVCDAPAVRVAAPTRVRLDGSGIRHIAAGGMHSLAVDASGRAWSWGQNKFGQLGRDSVHRERCGAPGLVALPEDVEARQAAGGWAHSALVSADGRVFTFGWGLYHQLGHGTTQNEREPVAVDALLGLNEACRVVQVACGTWHTAARTASGDLYTWGWGPNGQLGGGKTSASLVYPRVVDIPRAVASATTPELPGAASEQGEAQDVVDVACGARFTASLLRSGAVVWCGLGAKPPTPDMAWQVAHRPEEGRVHSIAAGAAHAFALVESIKAANAQSDAESTSRQQELPHQ